MSMGYKRCVRCVMDTTDHEIVFDAHGVCNHCHQFDAVSARQLLAQAYDSRRFDVAIDRIRQEGKDRDYDCVIGLSGGVDSSYMALLIKDFRLRPLVLHVDVGWNSELAVRNIELVVRHCSYDLQTVVMDWQEVKDLQLAYLNSGVSNQDVVQDHAIFASLYHFANKNRVKYVFSGGNIATESVFPASWHHDAMDSINLRAIHKQFGRRKLVHYKTISFFQYYFYYPFIRNITTIRPLNFFNYSKEDAICVLQDKIGYREYDRKHGESRFTKLFQNYYLPKRFGIDKRLAHLSSMILSGNISREHAVAELEKPLYDEQELKEDKEYVAKKLGLSAEEFDALVNLPIYSYSDYPNWDNLYARMLAVKSVAERILGRSIKGYS